MEQYRRVELFNANSEIYWNINRIYKGDTNVLPFVFAYIFSFI